MLWPPTIRLFCCYFITLILLLLWIVKAENVIFDPQTSYDPRLRTTAPRGPLCDAHGISELFYRTFPLVLVCMCVCVCPWVHMTMQECLWGGQRITSGVACAPLSPRLRQGLVTLPSTPLISLWKQRVYNGLSRGFLYLALCGRFELTSSHVPSF